MCYNVSIFKSVDVLELRFQANFTEPEQFKPIFHVSSFVTPKLPVITDKNSTQIELFTWGLIPLWVKNVKSAEEIRFKTMNARAESIYEKTSFRNAAKQNHCLILVDGFYEWRYFQGKNYPHYIRLKSKEAFALAGLWSTWVNTETNEQLNTFTVITTQANPLMEKIHNKKKRMPVILPKESERLWFENTLTKEEMQQLLVPYNEKEMEAYTISRLITAKEKDTNVVEVMDPYMYPELEKDTNHQQRPLF
jgi:putative SOS response-associated peptidase YedK